MANISLTNENIKYIRDAFSHFFPEETVYSADKPYTSGEFNWNNRQSFIGFVYRLTGIQIKSEKDLANIKKAELEVEKLAETGGQENKANVVPKGQREQFEIERQAREESQKKAVADAKIAVGAAIKRQQELAEITKSAKVYVKIKSPTPAKITDDQQKSIETLKTAAKANPQKLTEEIAKTIEEKVAPSLPKDISKDEAGLIYKQTAYRVVSNLQGNSLAEESVIQNGISLNKSVLPKIIPAKDTLAAFGYSAKESANAKILEYVLTRHVASATFGEPFANNVFGPENLNNISAQFSAVPRNGFVPYDLSQIPNQYSSFLENQNSFIGGVMNFAEGEIKSQLLSQAGSWLNSQVAKMPADSFFAQTFNSEVVKGALSYFGMGTPVAWEGTTFFGRIAIQNGLGPVLGWAQNLTGINFGISKAVSAVAGEVIGNAATTAATTVGTEVAAGTVGATVGAGAAAATQIAIPIPVIGAAIGLAITWIGKQIAKLIPPKTLKKWSAAIIGTGVFAISALFLGIGAGLGLGAGATVVSIGLGAGLGGVTSAGILAGIAGLFGALGGAFLGAIAMPILVTLLVFPVVVASILFIINSGAYVVPPGVSGSPVGCNTQSTQIVQRASSLAGNLRLGFNRYYNNSPDYPDLWNAALFARIPNPINQEASIGAEDMFWCNYMATKSFEAGSENIPFPLSTMIAYFQSQQKWVNGPSATYNDVCPGDAIFFYNTFDPPGSISHVGIVAGVSADGITTFESNAPWRGWLYPTDTSGHFESTNSLNIIGFGRP